MNFLVLGGGTWGITLAALLESNGHDVCVWEFDPAVVAAIRSSRSHPRLPHLKLSEALRVSDNLSESLAGRDALLCVVPAAHVRSTLQGVAEAGYDGQPLVIASKGIEHQTHALMAQVAADVLGELARGGIAVLSGPSHAEEVSRQVPTAVVAAADSVELAQQVRQWFGTAAFRLYTQTDVAGVELGAALKNVIAIACGISDGLGFGDNSKAAIMTRGLSEIVRLGVSMGARQETFYGLAGVGDLIVTCTSQHSRNRNFGYALGKGMTPEQALEEVGMVVEGYYTVRAAAELSRERGIDMPITLGVAAILFQGIAPADAVAALMTREPKSEMEG